MGLEVIRNELNFFERVKDELLKTQRGKFALIKGEELVGTFTTAAEAYREGIRRFGKEPFLIKPVVEIEEEQRVPAMSAHLIHANL